MKDKILIEVALKESRGDGDKVLVAVANHESITIKDGYINIIGLDGGRFIFMLHNVLYLKTVKEDFFEEILRADPKKKTNAAEEIEGLSKTMLL